MKSVVCFVVRSQCKYLMVVNGTEEVMKCTEWNFDNSTYGYTLTEEVCSVHKSFFIYVHTLIQHSYGSRDVPYTNTCF